VSAVLPPSRPVPTPSALALGLGCGGLLPFVAGAALMWLAQGDAQTYAARALVAYAALILSFLGGIHWGLAMRQSPVPAQPLLWGVVPSLAAWPAVLMPAQAGLVLLGLLLVLSCAVDHRAYPRLGVAPWLGLRLRLSGVAALACFMGAAGA